MYKALEYIASVCNTILGALSRAFPFVFGVPAMIATGITALSAFVYSLFQDWTIGTKFTQLLGYASQAVQVLSGSVDIESPAAQNVLAFTACDSLASYFVIALTATVGVTIFIFATIFVLVVPLLVAVIGVRLVLKLVRICSLGVVDP